MRHLKALAAATVLAALIVGVPIGLLAAFPNPFQGFEEGLVTDTTLLDALACLCWLFWAQMMIAFTLEAINQIRAQQGSTRRLPVPAFGLQYDLVHALIAAILAVGIAGTSMSIGITKAEAAPNHPTPSHITSQATTARAENPGLDSVAATRHTDTVIVQPGDSLWKLAQIHLGAGTAWREIADLNHGRDMGGGVIATTATLQSGLQPGWKILIPTTNQAANSAARDVVEPGDNLSEIAEHLTGNAENWHEIYQTNRAEIGDDPNLIYPGEVLTIPNTHIPAVNPSAPRPDTPPREDHYVPRTPTRRPDPSTPSDHTGTPQETGSWQTAPTPGKPQVRHQEVDSTTDAPLTASSAPWIVAALVGSGTILSAVLYLQLRRRRRDQFRTRRPGRGLTTPSPVLAPLERTIHAIGGPASTTVTYLDLALRRLGASIANAGGDVPTLAAIELTEHQILAHLIQAAELPEPWAPLGDERQRWYLDIPGDSANATSGKDRQFPAPYPLLATIGQSEDGHWWLLNCEQLATIAITGDTARARDLLRYVAAELALADWAQDTHIDLIGLGHELATIDEARLTCHDLTETRQATSSVLASAQTMLKRAITAESDAATGRITQPDDEIWGAQLLLIDTTAVPEEAAARLIEVSDLARAHPGRTATAVVSTSDHDDAFALTLTEDGQLHIPAVGLTLTPVQLPATEAVDITALLHQATDADDTALPCATDAGGWEDFADASGDLRPELTIPRTTPSVGTATTVLEADDEQYLATAAVTPEDLETIAPQIPEAVSRAARAADPTLDEDMVEWIDHTLRQPRLQLLGPVKAFAYGPNTSNVAGRIAFYTELIAFLWTKRDQGATAQQLLEAFPTQSENSIRKHINVLREWLGTNPKTGELILPPATSAPAKQFHGHNVYQVDDGPGGLLVDLDLLRRTHLAGKTSPGASGIERIRDGLIHLVTGEPFEGMREGRWNWMLEGDRLDEHAVITVADMAHLATTHYLQAGDIPSARLTADIGHQAAPYEDTNRLDLAAVTDAEGHHAEAMTYLRREVLNRCDHAATPLDNSGRTRRILKERGWDKAV